MDAGNEPPVEKGRNKGRGRERRKIGRKGRGVEGRGGGKSGVRMERGGKKSLTRKEETRKADDVESKRRV